MGAVSWPSLRFHSVLGCGAHHEEAAIRVTRAQPRKVSKAGQDHRRAVGQADRDPRRIGTVDRRTRIGSCVRPDDLDPLRPRGCRRERRVVGVVREVGGGPRGRRAAISHQSRLLRDQMRLGHWLGAKGVCGCAATRAVTLRGCPPAHIAADLDQRVLRSEDDPVLHDSANEHEQNGQDEGELDKGLASTTVGVIRIGPLRVAEAAKDAHRDPPCSRPCLKSLRTLVPITIGP